MTSFAGPFAVASVVSYFLIGWTLKASLIAGTALSTTSLAVVYAVLVERDLVRTEVGKLLMSDVRHRHLHGRRAFRDFHQAKRLGFLSSSSFRSRLS